MPDITRIRKPTVEQQRAVLRCLSQQVAAELVGKSPAYLRDQSHVIERNDDGTYDAAAVVRWAVSKCQPATLSDDELEPILQLVENIAPRCDRYDFACQALEAVARKYGGAGLAAIGQVVLDNIQACHESGPSEPSPLPTREEFTSQLVADAKREAGEHYEALRDWHAEASGRSVTGCGLCDQWRMGRQWNKGPLPPGYVLSRVKADCPDCTDKAGGRQ